MDNSSQSSVENGMVFRKLKTNKTTTNDTNMHEPLARRSQWVRYAHVKL